MLVPPVKVIALARVTPSPFIPPVMVPELVTVMPEPEMPAPPAPATPLVPPLLPAPPKPPLPPVPRSGVVEGRAGSCELTPTPAVAAITPYIVTSGATIAAIAAIDRRSIRARTVACDNGPVTPRTAAAAAAITGACGHAAGSAAPAGQR